MIFKSIFAVLTIPYITELLKNFIEAIYKTASIELFHKTETRLKFIFQQLQ